MKSIQLVNLLDQTDIIWMGKPGQIKILMYGSTVFSLGDRVERQNNGKIGDIMLVDKVHGRIKVGYFDGIVWENVSIFGLEWVNLSTGE